MFEEKYGLIIRIPALRRITMKTIDYAHKNITKIIQDTAQTKIVVD